MSGRSFSWWPEWKGSSSPTGLLVLEERVHREDHHGYPLPWMVMHNPCPLKRPVAPEGRPAWAMWFMDKRHCQNLHVECQHLRVEYLKPLVIFSEPRFRRKPQDICFTFRGTGRNAPALYLGLEALRVERGAVYSQPRPCSQVRS